MKGICLISLLLGLGVICAVSQDSIVSIPDNAFLYALIDVGVDTHRDSLISYDEAKAKSTEMTTLSNINLYAEGGFFPGVEASINLEKKSLLR